ncbi:uncharacterized protein LOC119737163 isoform X2 [Patiria miniata]|uniref:Saposin B-type domain-containing protein n=1 Tax=Patiria miniata TaxID=46514 RepID=A0A914AUM8_PATMI|nr:uncharacterized protein LOC119737163 isoform X2 [Patiria miniata]
MQYQWLLSIIVLALAILYASAYKPTKFGKEVVCEGCHAFVAESAKLMNRKHTSRDKIETQIKDALKRTCDTEHLRAYEFSPPNMKKVCDYWATEYKKEITQVFKEYSDPEEREIALCFDVTDACIGVDRSNFRINKYKGPTGEAMKRTVMAKSKHDISDEL